MATLRKVRAAEKHRRRRARRVRVGRADEQLTPTAGLEAVRELDRVLGVTAALEAGIGAVKERRRGLGGGELVMAMASCHFTGAVRTPAAPHREWRTLSHDRPALSSGFAAAGNETGQSGDGPLWVAGRTVEP